jgi:hypothetical protein
MSLAVSMAVATLVVAGGNLYVRSFHKGREAGAPDAPALPPFRFPSREPSVLQVSILDF